MCALEIWKSREKKKGIWFQSLKHLFSLWLLMSDCFPSPPHLGILTSWLSSDALGTLQSQDFCSYSSSCLENCPSDILPAGSVTFFRSLLQNDLISETLSGLSNISTLHPHWHFIVPFPALFAPLALYILLYILHILLIYLVYFLHLSLEYKFQESIDFFFSHCSIPSA